MDDEEQWERAGHVVRPRGMRPYGVDVVRRARLYADGKTLVVRDRRRRERRFEVGAAGIRRAVFYPPPGDLWDTVSTRPAERWGVLVFKGEDERAILEVPLAEWLPEASVVGALDLRPKKCLDRTGLKELVSALAVPLEESPKPRAEAEERPEDGRGDKPHRAVNGELPRWFSWVRGIGILGWFVALVMAFAAHIDVAVPLAAGFLFLVPAADLVVRVRAWWRGRRQADTRLADAVLSPAPADEATATRRFRRTASVCVLPAEVVVTDTVGRERRLGRHGAHGVARLVRLVVADTRLPLGVEFRDGNGEARALIPWAHWFAGPQGPERWAEMVAALSVPVTDEAVKGTGTGGTRSGSTEPWWRGHPLAQEARLMSPMAAKEARAETSWTGSVIGGNELMLIPFFSLLLLVGLFADDAAWRVAGVLSALTIVGELVPAAMSRLISYLSYDRP
ncbi:hypothetical protein ABZT03_05005 [Streptomyces sp. NPDC005574]|uniref:hypothetical protein n=1 Tax=Streptomyces sp. NPDC005574 TaxID=3156891 RepID=UPI0033A347B1